MKAIIKNKDLKPSLKYSKEVMKHHAKSFTFAAQLLPKDKRVGSYAVYSFCRYADNVIDKPRNRTKAELISEIEYLRSELRTAYRSGESEHPALQSFIATANYYEIPIEYPEALLDGVLMDLNFKTYNNFDDLYLFCYRVASTVGLMMTRVLGFNNPDALIYAEKLGVAMQLTNILRDIQEDLQIGRIYLPKNEILNYGLNNNDFINQNFNNNFNEFMKFQVERAKAYYNESEKGIKMLSKDAQFSIHSASKIYRGILSKIEAKGYNPFSGRAYVSTSSKIAILLNEYFRRRISLILQTQNS